MKNDFFCNFFLARPTQPSAAMGMTNELIVGHYFKRLVMIEASFGNAEYHLERFAGL